MIPDEDLLIEVYPRSGNVHSDQGVRLTHLPTGLVAESHEERSQMRNKAAALEQLQAMLDTRAGSSAE